MDYETEKDKATSFFNECLNILTSKAHDYASDGDCFSNFKKIANMMDLKTEQTFLQFISVKVARLVELISGKSPKNESIKDSLLDLANYSCLMSLYLQDK